MQSQSRPFVTPLLFQRFHVGPGLCREQVSNSCLGVPVDGLLVQSQRCPVDVVRLRSRRSEHRGVVLDALKAAVDGPVQRTEGFRGGLVAREDDSRTCWFDKHLVAAVDVRFFLHFQQSQESRSGDVGEGHVVHDDAVVNVLVEGPEDVDVLDEERAAELV